MNTWFYIIIYAWFGGSALFFGAAWVIGWWRDRKDRVPNEPPEDFGPLLYVESGVVPGLVWKRRNP